MDHAAGVAVPVADEAVDNKVTDDLLYLHSAFNTLPGAQRLQRGDETFFVRIGDGGLGVVENIGIALWVVVNVLQLYIGAAHTAASEALKAAGSSGVTALSAVARRRSGRVG